MKRLENIIRFYHECYLHDFKGIKINDFYGKNGELQKPLDTNFLVVEDEVLFPINEYWGAQLMEMMEYSSKEKSLYAGSYFINGKIKILGKEQRLFCPLYIHELELVETKGLYSLVFGDSFVNPTFLESVKTIDKTVDIKYDLLADTLPSSSFGLKNMLLIEKCLSIIIPNLDLKNLHRAIETQGIKGIEDEGKKENNISTLHLGLAVGVFKKPSSTRGVLDELSLLTQKRTWNPLLRQVLGEMSVEHNDFREREIFIPASLSEAQQEVFYSVDNNDVTLVIGPPGTGKSFTIAALASELISNGKSVLIASKNNQAGKVIADKIENQFGLKKTLVKTERKSFWRSILSRSYNTSLTKLVNESELDQLKDSILHLQHQINGLIDDFIDAGNDELKWGNFYADYKGGLLDVIQSKWYQHVAKRTTPIWRVYQEIGKLEKEKITKVKRYIRHRYDFEFLKKVHSFSSDFDLLISAIKEESGNIAEALFNNVNFKYMLKAMPAWIVNSGDVSKALPLTEELFDVLIIDEASQCDIATTLPLIYRAKKLVVVGDPKQLRHYSFLSKFQQNLLREKLELDETILDFRDNSILDLLVKNSFDKDYIIFLDEHYRSQPNLIDFSNGKFYNSKLKLMTSDATSYAEDDKEIIEVAGARDAKGVNHKEAEAILEYCREIFHKEQSLSKNICSQIGIISPFAKQVTYIKSQLRKEFDISLVKKHKILIGTPYHFQGEERDIVLLSFTVDDDTHHSVFNYLNKEDVFNVTITRAKKKIVVFNSVDYKNLDSKYLVSQYLNSKPQTRYLLDEYYKYRDAFANEVIDVISEMEVDDVLKNFPVAGVDVDLLVVKNDKNFCIDLIGYPGDFEEQFSMEKLRMLNRMEHRLFFLPYSYWFLEREKCIDALSRFLNRP